MRLYHHQAAPRPIRGAAPSRDADTQPAVLEPPVTAAAERDDTAETIPALLAPAFAWGALAAFATAATGLVAHVIASRWYPQPYEQIPSDFFFVPLGCLVGFIAVGAARVAGRTWEAPQLFLFTLLVAIAYGGMLFQYSRHRSLGPTIMTTLEPAEPEAIACSPDVCPPTDPPCPWYVKLQLRMGETSGIGARIDRIEITSYTESSGAPRRYTKDENAEASRWRGPFVTLTGGRIPGPRRLTPNTEAIYPIVYPYHSPGGVSRRKVLVSVYMTDGAGRPAFSGSEWRIQ